jgi:hypothetical protein
MQEISINKSSKIFFTLFFFFVMISIVATYFRYVVNKEYEVFINEEDIPATESISGINLPI